MCPYAGGAIFEGSNTDFRKIIMFIYLWSNDFETSKFCSKGLELDKKCAVAWRKRLRDVAAESVLSHPCVIGGPGHIVEVDETLFSKKKSHRGREYPRQWVFGGVCRETGESFLVPVADRSSRTLIPLIRQYIRPGTTVISDYWGGYRRLSREDYTHLRVNHSINFVHPDDPEVHTQSELDSYFCDFMWRRRVRPNQDPFDKMLGDIATHWAPI
ncbi:hypothetical protein M514_21495 [Trichuris suis]|uniref:ISXO2-like transposase domain-containing protein n=1 Tax=Trichuris suis TaxID=68888 RepID=A0A085N9R2_9BILA|nr:hypothetical protein M514_21495 [Trichuris suis]